MYRNIERDTDKEKVMQVTIESDLEDVLLAHGILPSSKLIRDLVRAAGGMVVCPEARAVLRLAVTGAPNKAIAAKLHITERGVEYHLATIYTRLGIVSRLQLGILLGLAASPGDCGIPQ